MNHIYFAIIAYYYYYYLPCTTKKKGPIRENNRVRYNTEKAGGKT